MRLKVVLVRFHSGKNRNVVTYSVHVMQVNAVC